MAETGLSTKKIAKVNGWLRDVHDWLLPASCVLCGHSIHGGRDLCAGCAAELPYLGVACAKCAMPLSQDGVCGVCQAHRYAFDETRAVFRYESPMDYLIHQLKFAQKLYIAPLLAELMLEHLEDVPRPDLLVPVPLHPKRLRSRGFNQALEIARSLAKRMDIPLAVDVCQRVFDTPAQSGLDAKQRRRNLKKAFAVSGVDGVKHVAILDDVMTTGTTVDVMAKALKGAGVRQVSVWVCARAVKD